MKTISYAILNPGGNVTALIKTAVSKKDRISVANILLGTPQFKRLCVEQVGYIKEEDSQIASNLEMANGELCVNATRCLGALTSKLTGKNIFNIKTSGLVGTAQIRSKRTSDNSYLTSTIFNLQEIIKKSTMREPILNSQQIPGQLIYLSGAAHFLTEWSQLPRSTKTLFSETNRGKSSQEIKSFSDFFRSFYNSERSLRKEDVVGFIAYRKLSNNRYRLWPLVKVNKQETIFYETACGSATLALAYSQTKLSKNNNFEINQPSKSVLRVSITKEKIVISGKVTIVCEGAIAL